MGFLRQEYWSGLLFPSPEDLPDPGIEPGSPMLQTDSLPTEPLGKPIYLSDQISHSVVSDSLRPHGLYPTGLLHPWNFLGKSTGVGFHFLLQGIFPTHGSNQGLPHFGQTLYHLSHQGIPIYILWDTHCSVTKSCPTLCDPMDHRPPGSSVHGVLQARVLEWVATPSSKRSSMPRYYTGGFVDNKYSNAISFDH